MLFVSASQLTEGMCVAEHVCDHYGRVLIARGQRIGKFHIERLQKFGIHALFIDTHRGEEPAPPTKSTLRMECEAVIGPARGTGAAAEVAAPDACAVRAAADGLVGSLMKTRRSVVTLAGRAPDDNAATHHAVSVAAIAVAVGIDFRLPEETLRDIGSAMLLHDTGMLLLPRELTHRSSPPRPRQFRRIHTHSLLGCCQALRSGAVTASAAELILAHHERLDGSGYPLGLRGGQLSLPIRIVAAAEAFGSLTSDRLGIAAAMPDAAIAWMEENVGTLFDADVVQALGSRIALYPNGTAVRLTTGETGIVAGTLADAPRRPVVLVHTDSAGRPLPEPLIADLTRDPSRAIARSAPTKALLRAARDSRAAAPINPALAALG